MPSIKDSITKSVYFNLVADEDILDFIENSNLSFSTLIKRLIRREIILNPIKYNNPSRKYKHVKGKSNFQAKSNFKSKAKPKADLTTVDTILIVPNSELYIQKINASALPINNLKESFTLINDKDNAVKNTNDIINTTTDNNVNNTNNNIINNDVKESVTDTSITQEDEPINLDTTKNKLKELLGTQTLQLKK